MADIIRHTIYVQTDDWNDPDWGHVQSLVQSAETISIDFEWDPDQRGCSNPISVMQIGVPDPSNSFTYYGVDYDNTYTAIIISVVPGHELLQKWLWKVLEDEDVVKVLACNDMHPNNGDFRKFRETFGYCIARNCGVISLGVMARERGFNRTLNATIDILKAFNALNLSNFQIFVVKGSVWINDGPEEKVWVEPFMENFEKFNSNTGADSGHDLLSALSHFSYHHSSGQLLLCDLQGSQGQKAYTLTDPVIMSRNAGTYGPADLGIRGGLNFFYHHSCGRFCQRSWESPPNARYHFEARMGTSLLDL
ncbi:hypothetical protein HDV00_003014 [Rhizophlyctis rosea]|nr:hypothetical protein HDV00_003014 [Rhizophlyctis rosea]